MSDGRDERGSATVWAVHLLAMLMVAALAAAAVTALVAGHRRAQAAADLAALAGATAVQSGDEACRAAAQIALRNGARIDRCAEAGGVVTVRAVTRVVVLGRGHDLLGLARAGPADAAGAAR